MVCSGQAMHASHVYLASWDVSLVLSSPFTCYLSNFCALWQFAVLRGWLMASRPHSPPLQLQKMRRWGTLFRSSMEQAALHCQRKDVAPKVVVVVGLSCKFWRWRAAEQVGQSLPQHCCFAWLCLSISLFAGTNMQVRLVVDVGDLPCPPKLWYKAGEAGVPDSLIWRQENRQPYSVNKNGKYIGV